MIQITGLLYKDKSEVLGEGLRMPSKRELETFGDALWKHTPYNEVYIYDLDEQIYKKRKVYFHISHVPLKNINARINMFRSVPAAFFAMDFRTCIDFFKYRYNGKPPAAFIHRCVNNRSIDLFNPASSSDADSLKLNPAELDVFNKLLQQAKAEGKNTRYWIVMEQDKIMKTVYSNTKYDGIALDFYKQGATSWKDRTEGFCLFDRGISAMAVMDIVKVDEIPKLPIDPKKLMFYVPGSPELK